MSNHSKLLTKLTNKLFHPSAQVAQATDALFDGDDYEFKVLLGSARVYGEYGCGKSTRWVLSNSSATIYSVDSSQQWVDSIKVASSSDERMHIHWVDLGEVGNWGRPLSYKNRESFPQYTDWIWQRALRPDCVLIDGRFRVACFLTSVLHAEVGTSIIFDDYRDRPHYHVIEEVLQRDREFGRQAIFTTPMLSTMQTELANQLLEKFRYVMD